MITPEMSRLVSWTHSPTEEDLAEILKPLRDADLMVLFTAFAGQPAGQLAWAEYGRRQGYFDFKIVSVVGQGQLTVTLEGPAKPIHHGAAKKIC
jgi:hypothetical protein